MTEKEKMLNGELYFAGDQELVDERNRAKDLLYDFNLIRPSEREKRKEFFNKFFGSTGKNLWIESPFQCDYGYNIEVGKNFYANHNCVILDCAKVTIGDNVFIGPNVGIYAAHHPLDVETRIAFLENAFPVAIGNNVWIGGGVTILPGVSIGDNCVIGAGSVVTKNIPANVVAVGNPCRAIKEIV